MPVTEVGRWLRSVVRGWFNYHAVPGNIDCLEPIPHPGATSLASHVFGGEARKANLDLGADSPFDERWLPNARILHPYPDERLIVSNPR